jgi:TolA-binding protein
MNTKVKLLVLKKKTEKRREKIRELVKQEFEKIAAEKEAAAKGETNENAQPNEKPEEATAQKTEPVQNSEDVIAQAKEATRMFFKGDDENVIEKETLKIIGVDENEVYTCPSCKHERNKAETLSFLQRVSNHFTIPITYLQNGQYSTAEEFFNRILDRYSKFLHSQSYYLMNARVQLLNCYIYQQKWDDCIPLAKTIIEAKEKSNVYTTKYSPEIMDLYESLGDYCSQSLEARKSDILNTSSSNSDIRKKYLTKERSKAYETCLELRTAVFGKDHPKTLAIKRKIDAL